MKNKDFTVKTIPLNHRIYTNGFLFEENYNQMSIKIKNFEYKLEVSDIKSIKKGKISFKMVKSKKLTFFKNQRIEKYAFCSDTVYMKKLLN